MTDKCPSGGTVQHADLTASEASGIFDDLTAMEMLNVIRFMKAQKCFNLKEFDNVTINSTYIHALELQPPTKVDALRYLNKISLNIPPPKRYAKVVLYR